MDATAVLSEYRLGEITGCAPYGCGHINETFDVIAKDGGHYILQKINTGIFRDVDGLMENIIGVTGYLREKYLTAGKDPERGVLCVIPAADGKTYFRTPAGECYRLYRFIEHTVALQTAKSPRELRTAGLAFGQFTDALASYPAEKLHETIPHFHDTASRYADFEEAVRRDPLERSGGVAEEIAFVRERRKDASRLGELLAAGELPLRVTHNDTKLNNVLLDEKTGLPVAVIDLDTVMPGLSLYDFGDAIRFGSNPAAEDEKDLSLVFCELRFFKAYTEGYLQACGKSLWQKEIELLPFAAKIMTYECGMRFLTDYLLGDTYFRIHRPEHNLDRCRTQLKLVADMEEKEAEMTRIVSELAANLR